jgi:hypothetical protein
MLLFLGYSEERHAMTFNRVLAIALSFSLLLVNFPQEVSAAPARALQEDYAELSESELDALVAPIALYPDALVAQVLGAATFPDQVVEANDYLKSNPPITGAALQSYVEQQSWDPAVQALTQFPSVLDNLAKNISWTSALGEASALQQEAALAAVQRMRAQAYAAGNLKSGSEIKVVQQNPQVIVIEPANPQIVYVPTYNPTVVYGTTVVTPGYSTTTVVTASVVSFGAGVAVGMAISNSSCGYSYWGWGMSWSVRTISCGGGYYYGNPYWWGGYYPGYHPGYRPPYYPPPRPPYPGYRPPYPGARPPYPPGARPPYPGKPTPLPAPVPTPRPSPGKPGSPTTLPSTPTPRPTPGNPTTMPAPSSRPAPVPTPRPGTKELRGYPQAPAAKPAPAQKPNAFSGSAGGRQQSARGNNSMRSTPAPKASAAPRKR